MRRRRRRRKKKKKTKRRVPRDLVVAGLREATRVRVGCTHIDTCLAVVVVAPVAGLLEMHAGSMVVWLPWLVM